MIQVNSLYKYTLTTKKINNIISKDVILIDKILKIIS